LEIPDEHVKVLYELAQKADEASLAGECADHMTPEGFCTVCTALEQTQWRIHLLDYPEDQTVDSLPREPLA
jgi:hypothetical protein